jgi:energy-coupling factor transporter ATP-binding protein EcfA2
MFLSLVGAIAFELILPASWAYAQRVPIHYSPIFAAVTVWVALLILSYVILEPVRLRFRQWRSLLWYPPTWLALPIGWALAAATEHLRVGVRPQSSGPDWQHTYPIVPICLALLFAIIVRQLQSPERRAHVRLDDADTKSAITWAVIEAWIAAGERPARPSERDLFDHRRIASRIARVLQKPGQSIALLGPMGSGKSTILSTVRAGLEQFSDTVTIADFDVWAVPRPEDVPRLALSRMVAAIDNIADTVEFRGLPTSYQRLAAAEPTGRLSKLLGFESASDSIDEIKRLTPVLNALNAHLVLIVEDAERAGETFETRHLQRLLWALKRLERCSFILAVDPEHAKFDYSKLCETTELVPPLAFEHVLRLLNVAYDHWMCAYSFIDPHPNRSDGDKLRLREATRGGLLDYMQRTGRDTPIDALVALLSSPRAIKHLLRQVDRVWRNLHGEVELDDIIIVSAVRHGAGPAYDFLIREIDPARHKPDDILPRTKTVKDDWETQLKTLPNGAAVQSLVNLMGIEQLSKKQIASGTAAPQGVHLYEPVDYFRRIVAEDVAPGALRDQQVLREIDQWKNAEHGPLVAGLLASSDPDDTYSQRWEHFSFRHDPSEIAELTGYLVDRILARDSASAAADVPPMVNAWRVGNRRLRDHDYSNWLKQQLIKAVPVSLQFVNDMYYYWTGQHGIVDEHARATIREHVVRAFQSAVKSSDDLRHVLNQNRPYQIMRFITQTGQYTDTATYAAWRDYFPLLLIDGARQSDVVAAELANLCGTHESNVVGAKEANPPVFAHDYVIDRLRVEALFGGYLEDVLTVMAKYAGDNPWAVRARAAAHKWLIERGGA